MLRDEGRIHRKCSLTIAIKNATVKQLHLTMFGILVPSRVPVTSASGKCDWQKFLIVINTDGYGRNVMAGK